MPVVVGTPGIARLAFMNKTGIAVAPPAGTIITFSSTNPAVFTVGPVTQTGKRFAVALDGVAAGTAELNCHMTAPTGGPVKNKAGATISDPAPVQVTVATAPVTTKTTPVTAVLTVATA